MKVKLNWEKAYIWFVSVGIFFFIFTTYSAVEGSIGNIFETIYSVIWLAFRLFILLKVLFEFNRKSFVPVFVFLFIVYDFTVCSNSEIYMMIWFILGLKNVNLNKLFVSLFYSILTSVLFINIFCLAGIIPDFLMTRENVVRHGLGFSHPNAFAALACELMMIYIYLKGIDKRINIWGIVLASLLVYMIARSNTQLIICGISIIIILFAKITDKSKKLFIKALKKYRIVFIACLVSAIGYVVYNFNEIILYLIDHTRGSFYSRMRQLYTYLRYYGVSLLGKKIVSNYNVNGLYTLDNGYMYLFLGYGVIIFSAFIISYIIIIYKMIKFENYSGLLVIMLALIYGISETTMIKLAMNFTLFFIGCVLWNQWGSVEKYQDDMLRGYKKNE